MDDNFPLDDNWALARQWFDSASQTFSALMRSYRRLTLLGLFVLAIPIMILEFSIGHRSGKAFPQTLGSMAGKAGEFVGWWALLNAFIITMYYITILGWVLGMLIESLGPLWEESLATPAYEPEN